MLAGPEIYSGDVRSVAPELHLVVVCQAASVPKSILDLDFCVERVSLNA